MAGVPLPPLFIFSSDASEERMAVNDAWIETMGKIRGKWGHKHFIERLPYIAVRPNGSMDISLFQQLIKDMLFDLYPRDTVSLELVVDEFGRLVKGPLMLNCDTGPGRIGKVDFTDPSWELWADEMFNDGVLICGLLPNSTSITAVMDDLFGAYKQAIRRQTQDIYAEKVKKHAHAVKDLKADIARRREAGEDISDAEIRKISTVVTLDESDIGKMNFGVLDENGYPAKDSPWATSFTKEKIMRSQAKVSVIAFIMLTYHFFISLTCH
jgi:hypothetical protein